MTRKSVWTHVGDPPVKRLKYAEAECKAAHLEGPCHEFVGGKCKGYGRVGLKGKMFQAHRIAWELARSPIPKDLVIDHMCRNRACINPMHLRVVTKYVNATENIVGANWMLIGEKMSAKTHCPAGHPFSKENTYVCAANKRRCIACRKAQNKAWYQK
jgi:hypothetical protein